MPKNIETISTELEQALTALPPDNPNQNRAVVLNEQIIEQIIATLLNIERKAAQEGLLAILLRIQANIAALPLAERQNYLVEIADVLEPLRAAQNIGIYEQLDRAYQQHILGKLQAAIAGNRNNPAATITALKVILADNWTLVQSNHLCYTNNPNSAATKILCDIAEFIVAEQNEQGQSAINVLMPTVATVPTVEGYPDLTELDTRTILKTHILGREGAYLIPVPVITNYDPARGFGAIYNPYFDPFFEYNEIKTHKPDMVRLHAEEISRLAEHSPLSRAVCDAQKNYEAAISQQSNILGQIRLLLSQLQYNIEVTH